MNSENNHPVYTAEDIQNYLLGKLPAAQMHAMEKAALDDPFLSEAMEGYANLKENDWHSRLLLLKDNFSKGQTAKVIALNPAKHTTTWKVAAAILAVCGGVAISYLFLNKEHRQNSPIAILPKKQDTVNNTGAETHSKDTDTTITTPAIAKTTNTKPIEQPIAGRTDPESRADSAFLSAPGMADIKKSKTIAGGGDAGTLLKQSNEPATRTIPLGLRDDPGQNKVKSNEPEVYNPPAFNDVKKGEVAHNKEFKAQVVSQDGTPLPFANISAAGQNIRTYADAKGYFSLVSPDSILNIEIRSVGYTTQNFMLRSDTSKNKIVLTEDKLALNEHITVTRKATVYGIRKKQNSILVPDTVINVEPEDGWDSYDTYLTNNLSLPDELLQKKIHGEVEVSFEVQTDGALTNIKIDKSLCAGCDEAAMRVIKEGPRWKINKRGRNTAKVKVKF